MTGIEKFVAALRVVETFGKNRLPIAAAEHDMVFLDLSIDECPEDCEAGKKLQEYGFFLSEEYDGWVMYT